MAEAELPEAELPEAELSRLRPEPEPEAEASEELSEVGSEQPDSD